MDAKFALILLVALFAMIGQSHQESKMAYQIKFVFNKTASLNQTYLTSKFTAIFGSNIRDIYIKDAEQNQSIAVIETSVPFNSNHLSNKMCDRKNNGVLVLDGFLNIVDLTINKIDCTSFNLTDLNVLNNNTTTIVASSDIRIELSQFLLNLVILAGCVGWSMSKFN